MQIHLDCCTLLPAEPSYISRGLLLTFQHSSRELHTDMSISNVTSHLSDQQTSYSGSSAEPKADHITSGCELHSKGTVSFDRGNLLHKTVSQYCTVNNGKGLQLDVQHTSIDFPAPLSPVMMFRPGCRSTHCSLTSAKLYMDKDSRNAAVVICPECESCDSIIERIGKIRHTEFPWTRDCLGKRFSAQCQFCHEST